ncbi:hypothetical protein CERSUDRAFT_80549 [Gelatoporia subvermispora B]|uniref:Uncharacterized protein n=1 Tax=Ceriporiopsis subvermispora (strain B) TaxID=914234 RepID=M2QUZ4_CERS8|nr:hypothetical protein CERSUDRAFT_80549 [Gelatoporia subvermispora B]
MSHDMDQDDIDVESLQAQVDMSMAFTENLVASWMKSSATKLPSSKKRGNDERELEEYMRRPPRLGVGAAPSESTSTLGRDTARLKGKLSSTSKKRLREEEHVHAKPPSDDEEESRAGAIRKKPNVDPFGGPAAKKNKTAKMLARAPPMSTPAAAKNLPIIPRQSNTTGETAGIRVEGGKGVAVPASPDTSIPTSSITKKKLKKKPDTSSEGMAHEPRPTEEQSEPAERTSPVSVPTSSPQHETPSSPAKSVKEGTPKSKAPKPMIPLLNLTGPPPDVDSSQKKRRKKKKKKKAVVGTDATRDDA